MTSAFDELMEFQRETEALARVAGRLNWDQETVMPRGAAAQRAEESGAMEAVLHARRTDPRVAAWLAEAVAPRQRRVGLMLPNAPIHHLLARAVGRPLVLTSGNVVDEPIAYRDEDARVRLSAIADFFLAHDRAIHVRADDSVVAVDAGRATMVRRARGYSPEPLRLPIVSPRPVLACGAELKNTFCLVRGDEAILSPHIGDLENWETLQSFEASVEHFQRLFDVGPRVIAHDLHPEYLATKYARAREGCELIAVQHHHAHIAACLAEHGETGPAIGLACAGLGYGPDGTLWGGEVLVADLQRYERVGHLAQIGMPGGAAAIREPWRMAAAWLAHVGMDASPWAAGLRERNAERWEAIVRLAASPRTLRTSSMGRLFDAVAAWLGVCDVASYEGQAAIELEQIADPEAVAAKGGSTVPEIIAGRPFGVGVASLLRAVGRDVSEGLPVAAIAGRFHRGVADALIAACLRVRAERGLATVALGGGVFQNALLREQVIADLRRRGMRVLVPEAVPANDGGVSFGQAAVAAARLRGGG